MIPSLDGIDHVLVGVRDLEMARERWQRLGFTVTPRGAHIGWGTANYCIMFPDDYVELIGIVDPDQFTNRLDEFLADREGLMGLAFASTDAETTAAELAEAGLHPDDPRQLKRELHLPDGVVLPEFGLVFVRPEETPELRSFFCHHRTRELVWQEAWLAHANGSRGLGGMTVVVDSVHGIAPAYARIFGADAIETEPGEVRVDCGRAVLVFVEDETFARLYPRLAPPRFDGRPYPAMLTVHVRDMGDLAAYLSTTDIAPIFVSPDLAIVPPEEANGVAVAFAV